MGKLLYIKKKSIAITAPSPLSSSKNYKNMKKKKNMEDAMKDEKI